MPHTRGRPKVPKALSSNCSPPSCTRPLPHSPGTRRQPISTSCGQSVMRMRLNQPAKRGWGSARASKASSLKAARTCYSHLAGELGVALYDGLLRDGTLVPRDGHFVLSERGRQTMEEIGVPLPSADSAANDRRFAFACLDWSERRDHLAGSFAVALLSHCLDKGWLHRTAGSRALRLTPPGAKALGPWVNMSS